MPHLAPTKKGGARRSGAEVKNGAVAVARKKVALIGAIYELNFA